MSSSNPFDDGDSNPFFETTKVKSVINEEDVFGGQSADEPSDRVTESRAPMPEMAVPTGGSQSNSAILFALNDGEEENAQPIDFDDEQSRNTTEPAATSPTTTTPSGSTPSEETKEKKDVKFTDKAVGAAAKLLFGGDDDDGGDNQNEDDPDAPKRPSRKWYNFWKPSFYQPYFDVDTMDVLRRCLAGLVPIGKPFFERIQGNPDMYGPFWVTTTVLFLLAISSNFAEYLAYWMNGVESHWEYDFYKISIGAAVFYGFLALVPLIIWAIQRFVVKAKLTLIQIYCVYGYSLTAFLIATPFCIAPYEWVRYIVIILACILSCVCIIVAFIKALRHDLAKGIIVIIVALVFHVALSLTYKIYFFSKVEVPSSFSSASNSTR